MTRFHIREVLLFVLCIALAVALWQSRDQPAISSSKSVSKLPGGGECTVVNIRADNLASAYELQHRIGDGPWNTSARLRDTGHAEIALFVFESVRGNSANQVMVSVNGNRLVVGERDIHQPFSQTYIGLSLEQIREKESFLSLSWFDADGEDHQHAFRLVRGR